MRKIIHGTCVVSALVLSGCGPAFNRELSPAQLRTQEHFFQEDTINEPIYEIESYLMTLKYRYSDWRTSVKVSPDKKKASVWWSTPGELKRASTMAMVDFQENEDGTSSTAKLYSSNMFWKEKPLQLLEGLKMSKAIRNHLMEGLKDCLK